MLSLALERLQREKEDILSSHSEFYRLEIPDESQMTWYVSFKGSEGTIYAGEDYTLEFKFSDQYPNVAPDVVFRGNPPEHEHIYSNGYICMSVLYEDWSPKMTVNSTILSLLTMISNATEKARPANDQWFASYASGRSPKTFGWIYEHHYS